MRAADLEPLFRVPLAGRFALAFGLVIAVAAAAGVFMLHRASGDADVGLAYLAIVVPPLIAGVLTSIWLWRSLIGALRRMKGLAHSAGEGRPDVADQLREGDVFTPLMREVLAMGAAFEQRARAQAARQYAHNLDQQKKADEEARCLLTAEHASQLQLRDQRLKQLESERQLMAQEFEIQSERQRERAGRQEELLGVRERERKAREQNRQQLARDFQSHVAEILDQVQVSLNVLRGTAGEMRQLAGDSALRSQEAAAMAKHTDDTAATVARSAAELSNSALRMRGLAEASREGAHTAGEDATIATSAINELLSATREIGSIAGIISDITRQTSLLSINARIEAARAGEAGRGFAVVASEVMELASRTRSATDNIDLHIRQVTNAAHRSAEVLAQLGARVSELGDSAGGILEAAAAQCRATSEISDRMGLINRSTQSLSDSVQAAEDSAGQTEKRSTEVLQAAHLMDQQTRHMQQQVARFVVDLRNGEARRQPDPSPAAEAIEQEEPARAVG